MSELIEKQNILQKEAKSVMDRLSLIDFLSKFGDVKIVGSFALGLMTWPDIDIDLSVKELKREEYFEVVKFLFDNPAVIRLVLADNRALTEDLKLQGIPESMYLGVFVKGKYDSEWKIDIRFVKDSLVRAEKYIDEIKRRLNDENREIILKIKNTVCTHPKYLNKEVFGVDIYNSVLDGGVTNFDEFKKYLSNKGINL